MKLNLLKKMVLAIAAAVLFTATVAAAQTASTDEGKRKIKARVSPAYPELARRMSVAGKVKIEVVITPDGRVRSTRIVGGHPLLGAGLPGRREGMEILPPPVKRPPKLSNSNLRAYQTRGLLT